LKQTDLRTSFTAADSFPVKVIMDDDVRAAVAVGRIPPIHIQFIPTNKCNQTCAFCSCSERDKALELPFDQAKQIIDDCKALGTKAVTITGGGEPCCYPKITELIEHFLWKGIKVGMVTNAIALHKIHPATLNKTTWCRISISDERPFDSHVTERISRIVKACPSVDWAFSYVVGPDTNYDNIERYIRFAKAHNFTHMRLVPDLFVPETVDMVRLQSEMALRGVDDSLAIYQNRQEYSEGSPCYICFLKPLIGPDAQVYACCGVQYALAEPSRDLPEELCLGEAKNMKRIMAASGTALNGSVCVRCYYSAYNQLLSAMLKNVAHKEFV
jgi:organic radical activating enzyme